MRTRSKKISRSVVIPQEIIDNVIAAVGNDTQSLKKCTLVSSSFLRPSRKQLFSRITLRSDRTCQGIYQLLVQNPVMKSFVRTISIDSEYSQISWNQALKWMNCISLFAILQLPFCNLEHFSISMEDDCRWGRFSIELRDAFLKIIYSSSDSGSTLKTLSLTRITELPITFFSHIVYLKTLELHSIFPYAIVGDNSSSMTSKVVAPIASHTAIDRCVWHIKMDYDDEELEVAPKPIFLPFLCRLRFLEISMGYYSQSYDNHEYNLDILSLLMDSLYLSLTSPATLEHLEFNIRFYDAVDDVHDSDNFRNAWSRLDSITTYSTSSQLQRVDISISYDSESYDRDSDEEDFVRDDSDVLVKSVLDGLPLLRAKGILFVKAT